MGGFLEKTNMTILQIKKILKKSVLVELSIRLYEWKVVTPKKNTKIKGIVNKKVVTLVKNNNPTSLVNKYQICSFLESGRRPLAINIYYHFRRKGYKQR